MLNYTKLARKPKQFQKFTGITVLQFDFLFSKIEKQYKITEMKRLSKRERIRDIGAGRPFKLPVKERILMLLIYYRCYTSYDLLEYLFGVIEHKIEWFCLAFDLVVKYLIRFG